MIVATPSLVEEDFIVDLRFPLLVSMAISMT